MPVFACPKCNSVENTARCRHGFWRLAGLRPLCSACDPAIGEWHGDFERRDAAEVPAEQLYGFGSLERREFDMADYERVIAESTPSP